MFTNWFRRPLKYVRLLKGSNGRFRWTARIDGRLMAVCRVGGYATLEEARAAAKGNTGRRLGIQTGRRYSVANQGRNAWAFRGRSWAK